MRVRAFIILIATVPIVACSTAQDPSPTSRGPSATSSPTRSSEPPRAADELAAVAPIELMVDLGPAGWTARYNRGKGIAVTARNWAQAYEISDAAARQEMSEARRAGQRAAATEQWRFEPQGPRTGYSQMRLTIRQYRSLAAIGSAWWHGVLDKGTVPSGLTVPSGMRIACGAASDASDAYPGAWSAGCVVTIADTTVVYLSRLEPAANDARAGAANAIQQWLKAVRSG